MAAPSGVRDDDVRAVGDAPPGRARPRAPVDLLVIGEERLVEETEGAKKQDTKLHPDKGQPSKGQTKGGGGTPTSVRPKV